MFTLPDRALTSEKGEVTMLIAVVIVVVLAVILGGRMMRANRRSKDQASSATVPPPPRPRSPEPQVQPRPTAQPQQEQQQQAQAQPQQQAQPQPVAVPSTASAPPASGLATTAGPGSEAATVSGWPEARRLRALLLARRVPETISVWEVVPEQGEVFFYDVGAGYERYYGREVHYAPVGGFFFGSPAFILAGLAVSGVANASRRNAAQAEARTQWREAAYTRLLISNHRLVCLVQGQWISFHYAAMTAVYPEVAQGALIAEFAGIPPLRISGLDAPVAAVMTVFATHGLEALASHPSLQVLGPV